MCCSSLTNCSSDIILVSIYCDCILSLEFVMSSLFFMYGFPGMVYSFDLITFCDIKLPLQKYIFFDMAYIVLIHKKSIKEYKKTTYLYLLGLYFKLVV